MVESNHVIEVLRKLLPMTENLIDRETKLKDLRDWDSMTFLKAILILEKEHGCRFDPVQLTSVNTVQDLIICAKRK